MTARPPVRMCARCQRTTDEPVLVHEVHAATGPGFNVYACPDCADHYPPQTDPLELLEPEAPRPSRMTIRVYKVDAGGAVIQERSEPRTWTGSPIDPTPQTSAFPPCSCPGCGTAR
ncbi:hypothetical protein ACFYPC_25615 [Streptomyces sp. NPDC005808]|uniref:hypothetical protein n=1 Tax=Streptomyces sp. NPDC005808 TaxID=3364734 RepID=UPI0036916C24